MERFSKLNIFAIPNYTEFESHLEFFVIGHSHLEIYSSNSHGTRYKFTFVGVEYLQSPVRWNGCSINIVNKSECRKFLQYLQLEMFHEDLLDFVAEKFKLYEIGTEPNLVRILALGVSMEKD